MAGIDSTLTHNLLKIRTIFLLLRFLFNIFASTSRT
nr:MAG TPA: hypothetical protein [Caudoviricetes sp.]